MNGVPSFRAPFAFSSFAETNGGTEGILHACTYPSVHPSRLEEGLIRSFVRSAVDFPSTVSPTLLFYSRWARGYLPLLLSVRS